MNKLTLTSLIFITTTFYSDCVLSNDQKIKKTELTAEVKSHAKPKFDWVKLTSNEWLKGDIISMYDEELEFDSDKLDSQTIDWEDVSELRSKHWQSIRLVDGTIVDGYLMMKEGQVSIESNGTVKHYKLNDILSIAGSSKNEGDLWDGYANLGFNLRRGNTVQLDYTFKAGVQRRSSSGRFQTDYTANYSKYKDKETNVDNITANSHRLTSTYDWFFDPKVYFRAVDFELLSDEFLNIDYRIRYGIAMGYHLIDSSTISWDINAGPSYQVTYFKEVQAGESRSDTSLGLTLGTDFSYEITSDIDYDFSYDIQIVSEDSGKYIHHVETGIEIDLTNDFDLDLTFYVDRTQKPKADAGGVLPEQNDYRLVVSLGYDF
ncbi:hypothetical protein GCM10009111_05900 [Colwellia asteriadis]|uniref:DUF481 domain-containing protein n=1 Tax=Colwellia asteriadis TaxID=517723 RepID=A0ABP3WH89_9GAMM